MEANLNCAVDTDESEALESVVADDEGKNGCLAKGEPQTGGLKTI